MADQEWYNLRPLLSRGQPMNWVIGARSIGKTYAFLEWAAKTWLDKKEQFVYVRRTVEGAEKTKWLFTEIGPKLGISTRTKGNEIQARVSEDMPWETFGFAIPLSRQQDFKGVPFPQVTKVLFDEFILESAAQRYVPNEVKHLNSLIDTIGRQRRVPLFMAANAGAIDNPYFYAYGVKAADLRPGITLFRDKGLAVEIPTLSVERDTRHLTAEYVQYSQANRFADSEIFNTADWYAATPVIAINIDGNYLTLGKTPNGIVARDGIANKTIKRISAKPGVSADPYDQNKVKILKKLINTQLIAYVSPEAQNLARKII